MLLVVVCQNLCVRAFSGWLSVYCRFWGWGGVALCAGSKVGKREVGLGEKKWQLPLQP